MKQSSLVIWSQSELLAAMTVEATRSQGWLIHDLRSFPACRKHLEKQLGPTILIVHQSFPLIAQEILHYLFQLRWRRTNIYLHFVHTSKITDDDYYHWQTFLLTLGADMVWIPPLERELLLEALKAQMLHATAASNVKQSVIDLAEIEEVRDG